MLAGVATVWLCSASLRGPKVSLRDSDLVKMKASMHRHGTKVMMIHCDYLFFIDKRENCIVGLYTLT